LQTARKSTGG
nr:Chain A, 10-mer peptide from histone H3 [synthetic construct]